MCCLFGIMNYSGKANRDTDEIINSLAQEATIRGIDSTGVAYNKGGKLTIYKKPLSAYEMTFKGMKECAAVIGHTRHATQGTHEKNYNNHPFMGYCKNTKFALAHNGVLWNDSFLRRQYSLPNDRIETDSFIAVQLLEHFNELNFRNIAKMCELVSGSFTFSMVDTKDNLWIAKGDNPLALIHFPHLKLYAYASTQQILFTALCRTDLVDEIASGDFEMVTIKAGDILKIDKRGNMEKQRFKYDLYSGYGYDWKTYKATDKATEDDFYTCDDYNDDYSDGNWNEANYLEELKTVAQCMGISPSEIDELIESGFTYDEIEDYIYMG